MSSRNSSMVRWWDSFTMRNATHPGISARDVTPNKKTSTFNTLQWWTARVVGVSMNHWIVPPIIVHSPPFKFTSTSVKIMLNSIQVFPSPPISIKNSTGFSMDLESSTKPAKSVPVWKSASGQKKNSDLSQGHPKQWFSKGTPPFLPKMPWKIQVYELSSCAKQLFHPPFL